jgi:hypothetical protein
MASGRQRAANRRNAQRSTGPRSAAGKRASRQNALRHGLTARLGEDPARDRQVETLAKLIAGPDPTGSQLHYARIAADATLRIKQIRALRTTMMEPAYRAREAFSWSFPGSAGIVVELSHSSELHLNPAGRRPRLRSSPASSAK